MELITKQQFLDYYGLKIEDVEEYDLQGMINDYDINLDTIASRDWYKKLKNDSRMGKQYGKNLNLIIHNNRKANASDNLRLSKYLVCQITNNINDSMDKTYAVAIDLREKKLYYDCDLSNIFICQKQYEIANDVIEKIFDCIDRMKLNSWENNLAYLYNDSELMWDLYFVLNRTNVIRYMGNIPGRKDGEEIFGDILNYIDGIIRSN